jgi:2-oxoglutarate ferredoxin oxidoreductase subunit gamma
MKAVKTDTLYKEVVIAGFGGQGIILAGKLLAQTAMKSGMEVTYIPSYGAEMRGGTANSMVIISDSLIASPLVTKPGSLIVMNKASLNKFMPRVKNGGLMVINSSLIDIDEVEIRKELQTVEVPADDIALELGSVRAANMVMVGAYLGRSGIFPVSAAAEALGDVLSKRYHKMLDMNVEALRRGAKFAEGD